MLKKKLFASWDRFLFPYPFSRGLFYWGDPIWVPREATAEDLEAKRRDLETELNRITALADKAVMRET